MIAEYGHFALILALILALIQSVLPLVGAAFENRLWMATARPLVSGQTLMVLFSFGCLVSLFLHDDFSVRYVAANSNTLLPDRYKVSAVWGAHEGSLLLWALILALWSFAVALFSRTLPQQLVARVLGVMGLISVGFYLFLLFTSNPFERNLPFSPAEGADLNPLLQDVGLIFHPPMLYMGYVGFSVVFAFAIAALLSGKMDAAWARWSRPWANIAWAILTIGIALGSWWAYYELGWGGWWAWDPVENPPLITWLFGTALVHSLAVTEKRGVFKSWTVLLAILAFGGSLLGTFITRSGLLTSVHAFASDPTRGVFILAILGFFIGGALLLYALRAPLMKSDVGFGLLSREIFLLANNVILVVAAASIFLGTLFPMIYQAITDDLISIGPPYFNSIFVPLMILLVLLLGIGPFSRWKRTSADYLKQQLTRVALASVVLGIVLPLIVLLEISIAATVALSLACWIVLSIGKDIRNRTANKTSTLSGMRSLSYSYYGMQLAHFGIAVMLVGVALTSYFAQEKSVLLAPGESTELGNYSFLLTGSNRIEGPNFIGDRAEILVSREGQSVSDLYPERRVYIASGTPSTEMAIDAGFLRDLFITLGERKETGAWSMTLYIKPFVRWIWLGSIIMAFGASLAAADKRYRRVRQRRSIEKDKTANSSAPSADAAVTS